MRRYTFLLRSVLVLVLPAMLLPAGCATTDDPRKGGLFSYNPEAYEQRLAERQEVLAQEENRQTSQKQQTATLETSVQTKQSEKNYYEAELTTMDKDLDQLYARLVALRKLTKQQKADKASIQAQADAVAKRLAKLKSKAGGQEEQKRAEIERLRKKLDLLLQEAEALSKM